MLYDGGEFGATAEEEDFLGLPGLLEPDQVAVLLRKRQADQLKRQAHQPERTAAPASIAAPMGPAPGAAAGQPVRSGNARGACARSSTA